MSDGRCRACGAALSEAARWCSLCYAPVRALQPAAVSGAAPPILPAPAPGAAEPSLLGELSALSRAADVPPVPLDGEVEPTWPCLGCGARVSIARDSCDTCGTRFLEGANAAGAMRLPLVGDVAGLSTGKRVLVGGVIGLAIMALLVAVASLVGVVL